MQFCKEVIDQIFHGYRSRARHIIAAPLSHPHLFDEGQGSNPQVILF